MPSLGHCSFSIWPRCGDDAYLPVRSYLAIYYYPFSFVASVALCNLTFLYCKLHFSLVAFSPPISSHEKNLSNPPHNLEQHRRFRLSRLWTETRRERDSFGVGCDDTTSETNSRRGTRVKRLVACIQLVYSPSAVVPWLPCGVAKSHHRLASPPAICEQPAQPSRLARLWLSLNEPIVLGSPV